jgi:hypothetical protein
MPSTGGSIDDDLSAFEKLYSPDPQSKQITFQRVGSDKDEDEAEAEVAAVMSCAVCLGSAAAASSFAERGALTNGMNVTS